MPVKLQAGSPLSEDGTDDFMMELDFIANFYEFEEIIDDFLNLLHLRRIKFMNLSFRRA